ncbi:MULTISPECIES: dTDP-4-dehydrorhamnose reductase [unclassified Granulicatella]|uniref:dTDP-4-dehydrorhamnose reductase n=1 Tax=unclassified Granulicatella TaxID=2630493 RepID=UPI001073913A|nr:MULTISPECIES: dTDP-4-dehydrorhamnose reductase [unclassified Granulicatella]MBF0780254.1 dTDP-4-dehydrorhamnose reductase [Granulicatella sp. 19428wC4_WM01]TFU95635.1 dTDP-4-dehydrorhamnose reductase [Granulicatella sp. WM01]
MTVLITGANGQLGKELQKLLLEKKIDFVAADVSEMDITNEVLVNQFISEVNPDVIYHCAAYTAVDAAEDEGKELNRLINVEGTRYISNAAYHVGAKLVYISTDYVFDGTKATEYTVDDVPNPKNEYGLTKFEGEEAVRELIDTHYIVRTSWVFGEFGKNFVYTMQSLAQTRQTLTIVNDQFGRPTWTRTLAEFMVHLIESDAEFGTYHLSNDNSCSWYEFAKEILKDTDVEVLPVDSTQFVQKAYRPKHSVMDLSKAKATGFIIPTWQDALNQFLGR